MKDHSELTIEEKASLLDALFSCERIRVLGYAKGGEKGHDGPIRHMGLEFWESYSISDADKAKYGTVFDNRAKFMEFITDLRDGCYE
jgi:hypothetical protein